MDLSQESITSHQFDLNRRGYDPDAVDAHLREIAAAAASRESELADLRRTVAELEAKVQDASESEEALRLMLKAAAHAKEELLAGAREQAAALEAEAADKAQKLVADAEAQAGTITRDAQARSEAMTQGATERARTVARAALSESELLVVRIEQLRAQVQAAEDSLRSLSTDAGPRLDEARRTLDEALEAARASAENPELLAAAVPAAPHFPAEPQPEEVAETSAAQPGFPVPATAEPSFEESAAAEPAAEEVQPEQLAQSETPPEQAAESETPPEQAPQAEASGEQPAPQLEVVESDESGPEEPAESSADISNKVDRLLEELREVT